MKYIKTKDGRIIDADKESVTLGYHPEESDSLEELCDEFDYYYDENYPHNRCYKEAVLDKWYDLDTDYPLSKEQTQSIKGAIWTEKGLKYVAKINESGELKLL